MNPGISEYSIRDRGHSFTGDILEEQFSGRVLLKRSLMPQVVVSYLDDTPVIEDFETGTVNRVNSRYFFIVMLKFLLIAPLMLVTPIWISVTRMIPNDARQRRIWLTDPSDPSKLLQSGHLILQYERNVLRGAVLNISSQAADRRRDIMAAVSILFVDSTERPREMQAK